MTIPSKSSHCIFAPTRERLNRWAAALEAAGIGVRIERGDGRDQLVVSVEDHVRARAELAAYESVNWGWPKRNPVILRSPQSSGKPLRDHWPIPFAAVVVLFFHGFLLYTHRHDTFIAVGGADNHAILAGEWFRAVTALTLHADWVHVIANAIWGVLFGLVAAATYGYGVVLLFAVLVGAMANVATAASVMDARTAIGASTAVMALLGLLTTTGIRQRLRERHPGRSLKILIQVLIGGLALLSLLGTAPGSDVTGHLLGFLSGLVGGYFAKFAERDFGEKFQLACMTLAILLVALAWFVA